MHQKVKSPTLLLSLSFPLSLSSLYRPDGCMVPLGTPIDTGLTNTGGYTLNYNEFIVYSTILTK